MDTNRIKRFATEARTRLKEGIAAKIITLGFDKKGNVKNELKPQLMQGGTLWNRQLLPESFYHQWMSLYNRVQQKGINEVYEEAAYTWFNRLCAIRILQKNNLCAPVLDYADSARTPLIVDEARQGRIPQMKEEVRTRLMGLLDDDTKVTEQFAVLITAWCHDNPIICNCFGRMADYTELLLPNNILAENGFVDMLNHTEFITDEDFCSPELIGWLYQFYISERKDEVFAKKGKYEADEIPAATQIFTPNWIVKYMVQNTVGRIYLDNTPYERQLQKNWQYLVEPSEKTTPENVLHYDELTDLRVADLACGSGHILNECFDLLYELYIAEGYGRGEAIENIFHHNLTGIDIDTRAKQLATFALLLKACQKDISFADAHCLPEVLTIPKPWNEEKNGPVKDFLHHFFQGQENARHANELKACFDLMQNADSLGSIMKFELSDSTRMLLQQTVEYWQKESFVPEIITSQMPAMQLILALTEKYHALVMNPPYLESGNMNAYLSSYVTREYKDGKNDLFTVFMILAFNRLKMNGKYAMINMDTWTYKSSFTKIRDYVLLNNSIESLILLGVRTFEELNGEVVQNVCFCMSKTKSCVKGAYFNVSSSTTCDSKRTSFLDSSTNGLHYINQNAFNRLPGRTISIIEEPYLKIFTESPLLSTVGESKQGLATGNNDTFIRFWTEVSVHKISLSQSSTITALQSRKKWFPYNKGGNRRKWYGNQELLVNWENDGEQIKDFRDENGKLRSRPQNTQCYFKPSISWGLISGPFFRYFPKGFIYDIQGMSYFTNANIDMLDILAWMNSKVFRSTGKIVNPREQYQAGDLIKLPYSPQHLGTFAKNCISLSKLDWDAHETSWDFKRNELLNMDAEVQMANMDYEVELQFKKTGKHICIDPVAPCPDSIEWCMNTYKQKWERLFNQLHENEEELNRQFIDIYSLQDELTPDVPLNEITILQQGEISVNENRLNWHDDNIIKQLISYAVGCMMGRYRLDKPGLHIAHPEPTAEEIAPYNYKGQEYEIDDDGIMPLMTSDCGFSDNAPLRLADFVRIAFGENSQVENLNYIEKCLGKTIEQYFRKDFWKDHKKMYQNRPIYWLFSSKKGAFQVIAYMHRMNAYTVERIRAKYLLPYIENVQAKITDLDNRRASLSTKETKQLQQLQKTLNECREYHDRLQVVAEQAIAFDLDDGVIVNHAKFGDIVQKIK